MKHLLPMSLKQLNHLDVLRRTERSEITQCKAAIMLHVTDRTIRRQLIRLKAEGPGFLQHGLKGRPSHNKIPEMEKRKIEQLLHTRYADFGPTFAAEKLRESNGINRDPKTIENIQLTVLIILGLKIVCLMQTAGQLSFVCFWPWTMRPGTFWIPSLPPMKECCR